jgi:hypothetical protein
MFDKGIKGKSKAVGAFPGKHALLAIYLLFAWCVQLGPSFAKELEDYRLLGSCGVRGGTVGISTLV